ncbi:MAG: hypothetical protein KGJ90_07130 [Patescibacteria group bacterium]|nr:hypothetical protein [Patescibacteria group bacterium]
MINYVIHLIAHWLMMNTGQIVSTLDDKGNVWVAFKCNGCGRISGAHITQVSGKPGDWLG